MKMLYFSKKYIKGKNANFEPIEVQTFKAPQNDPLNLNFVKETYAIGKKWPEMAIKQPFIIFFHFQTVYMMHNQN